MNDELVALPNPGSASGLATMSREIEQVRAAILMARHFPRIEGQALRRIEGACQNLELAKVGMYSYPKGGQTITGPSIRLAEVIAQNWGNLDFGVKEVDRSIGDSHVVSFCWDLETNVRKAMEFTVRHIRDTKGGPVPLKDERDIYEMVANMGSRRLRNAILSIVPRHIQDAAKAACIRTLVNGKDIEKMRAEIVAQLATVGVRPLQIETRIGKKIHAMTSIEYMQLQTIYNSLHDGMSNVSDWFSTLDPEKIKSESEAAANDAIVTPQEKEGKANELAAAQTDFENAVRAVRAVGLEADAVLKGKFVEVSTSMNPVMLRAATTLLKNAVQKPSPQGAPP